MSFVDRMLQDMLHRNMSGRGAARMARKAARRIGTKRLMMMGGAALAGGLLTEAARRQREGGASGSAAPRPAAPAVPGATPPLPPVPGSPKPDLPPVPVKPEPLPAPAAPQPPTGPTALATPTPPDFPAQEDELELPPDTLYAALRTMVAAALADGELSAEERELIERRLGESGLSEERLARVRRDLVLPAAPDELARLLPDGEPPELLLELALLVSRADSGVSAHENAWLRQLARALGVDAARLDTLERELAADDPDDD